MNQANRTTGTWNRVSAVLAGLLLVGAAVPAVDPKPAGPRIVFLVSEDPDNYEATRTIPPFAEMLQREHGYRTTVLSRTGPLTAARFPDLTTRLPEADLLVVFTRRVALPPEQIQAVKDHLKAGKPLVGIRTANHAFAPRGEIAAGHQAWKEFVPEVLGAENRGYGKEPYGVTVTVAAGAANHPILKGIEARGWRGEGSLYLTAPLLDDKATVLLHGEANGKTEPIAWTRLAGKSRVFYTSLGYPDDFKTPQFRALLSNGIRWALATEAAKP